MAKKVKKGKIKGKIKSKKVGSKGSKEMMMKKSEMGKMGMMKKRGMDKKISKIMGKKMAY